MQFFEGFVAAGAFLLDLIFNAPLNMCDMCAFGSGRSTLRLALRKNLTGTIAFGVTSMVLL